MKKSGAALFELIHSLSMAEKKYFKMFSSLQSGEKSYLKLYDAIRKQRSYSEDAIRAAFRGQKFLRQFFVANSRLYNKILRSLEIYHSSIDINLYSQLSQAKILLRKGLSAHALKLLKAAKSIAYEYEQWELLVEILDMERIPYAAVDLLKMPHMNEEMETVQKKLSNINDYRKIHHKITQSIQETGPMRTRKKVLRIEKLMKHSLLHNSKQALCAEAKVYYYDTWSFYYFFKRDSIKGYETAKEQCGFIEAHFHRLRNPARKYLFALNSSSVFTGHLIPTDCKKQGEMQEVLQKIRSYPVISGSLKAECWVSSYANELNAYGKAGDFEKVFPALKAIETHEDLLNQAPDVYRINLYYNTAYMLFGADSYNEALRWLRKIIDQPANAFRKDTQAYTRILYLLIQYELHKEDAQMLNSLERSATHFLSTRQRLFKVEKALLHCLRQIMGKAIGRKERSAALQEFKTTLLKLMKNPLEKVVMDEFDFLSWVESKIQNKTFAEMVGKKAELAVKGK